jgi:hypothetical protein
MPRIRVRSLPVLATAAVLLAASAAASAQEAGRGVLRTACVDDYKKFCAVVQPGGGRIVQCLREHEKDLAPACRDGLAKAKR